MSSEYRYHLYLIKFYAILDVPVMPIKGDGFLSAGLQNEQIGTAIQRAKLL